MNKKAIDQVSRDRAVLLQSPINFKTKFEIFVIAVTKIDILD